MTFELISHVPACWREPWRTVEVHPAQQSFFDVPQPWPIWVYTETPCALTAIDGPRAHIRQLEILADAAFATLEEHKPRFHFAKLGDQLIEASGTSIFVTAYERTGRFVIGATWDAGEDSALVLGRFAEVRRICKLDPRAARALLVRDVRQLPPPQLVLSNVISVGIEDGGSALGGYDARGAAIPISVIVMRKRIQFVFDHRIYNPPDEHAFVESFGERLRNRIERESTHGPGPDDLARAARASG